MKPWHVATRFEPPSLIESLRPARRLQQVLRLAPRLWRDSRVPAVTHPLSSLGINKSGPFKKTLASSRRRCSTERERNNHKAIMSLVVDSRCPQKTVQFADSPRTDDE
ncbi:hypothetical protein MRX96_025240 [Rhipicephalus microplus]